MRNLVVVLALMVIAAPGCLGGSDEPTAPVLAPGFTIQSTEVELPPKCRPESVRMRMVDAVEAFNLGRGESFAASFLETGQLSPYGVGGRGFVGRAAIAGFVSKRHDQGDGWSLTDLAPPLGTAGLPREAVYGAGLIVQQQTGDFRKSENVKVVIDCVSGLIRGWVGPPVGPPSE
jgi:hypothetical protein